MKTDLINTDYIIHCQKLSDKFNHRHFEIVFATLEETLTEKPRSFWEVIFSNPKMEASYSLVHRKYVKEGVAWYSAQNLERASVGEEVLLNRVMKRLEGCESSNQNIKNYAFQLGLKLTSEECQKLINKYLKTSNNKRIRPVEVVM
ncbi:MAG: hypothetical protein ACI81T_001702 [Bacteroidia bacterium]|jgi:hypothetical protein